MKVTIGDGKVMTATKMGMLRLIVEQKDGKKSEVVLKNVNYVPGLWSNLFSITATIKQGCKVSSKGLELKIKKEKFELIFDRIKHTENGFLMGVKMVPSYRVAAAATMAEGRNVSITTLHWCLEHPSEATTKATAKA